MVQLERKDVMTPTRFTVSLGLVSILLAFGPGAVAAQNASPANPGQGARTSSPATPAGPAAPGPQMLGPTPMTGATNAISSTYVIGPGDILQITVWKNETLSRVAPVRPDGKISMPLLHDIQASGLTAMQLRDKISTALGEFMPNPEVTVSVSDVRSMRVSILGEVQKPGVLELRGETTILEAIAMAGGFKDFASPSKITIIRNDESGKSKRIRFNYNRAVSSGSSDEENLVLRSGDVVVVP
jgi:polysaccharide export outer membrane protein